MKRIFIVERTSEVESEALHFQDSDDNKRFNTPLLCGGKGSRALPWGLIPLIITLALTLFSITFGEKKLFADERGSDAVKLSVTSPSVVKNGSDFIIKAVLKNTGTKTHTFVNLDIDNEYLKGVSIRKTQPQYSSKENYIDEITTFEFGKELKPGEEFIIEITATAGMEGSFKGDFDFCIDSDVEYVTFTIDTEVK
jgi:hypothetical protein